MPQCILILFALGTDANITDASGNEVKEASTAQVTRASIGYAPLQGRPPNLLGGAQVISQ